MDVAVGEEAVGLEVEEDMAERVRFMLSRFDERASGFMSDSSFLILFLSIEAPLPKAEALTLFEGSFFPRLCSSVVVSEPSWRYLKVVRFRESTFCGS